MKTKLILILIPSLIAIVIISLYSSNKIQVSSNLTSEIYSDSFKSISLILNADRDYYQALDAQNKLINGDINENNINDYKENTDQIIQRIDESKEIMSKNKDLYLNRKHSKSDKNAKILFEEFNESFDKWLNLYNIDDNTVLNKEELNVSFNNTRDILDQLGEILDDHQKSTINESLSITDNSVVFVRYISAISLFMSVLIGLIVIFSINKRTYNIMKLINESANLDFGKDYSTLDLGKDEFGLISKAEVNTRNQIKNTIRFINKKVSDFKNLIEVTDKRMVDINDFGQDVMSTTQQMTSSTQETAASYEEVNATIEEVKSMVEFIADEAEKGVSFSDKVCDNVKILRENTKNTQDIVSEVYTSTKEKLNIALDDSKAVEQINDLTNAILQITEQTNLLALNASIESARAGEAGKGFKVVSDEIRTLAEDSNNVVKEIKNTVKRVLESVDNLALNSKEMMDVVENRVIKGYKEQFDTIEKYNDDAMYFNTMSSDFNKTTKKLFETINTIVGVVNEISITNNHNAEGVSDVAKKINEMTLMNDSLKSKITESKNSMGDIFNSLEKFTIEQR
jgi:methyl-accepting chemotaxis protein